MRPSYLCYSIDVIYATICKRIEGRGYLIRQSDDERKELVVTRWFFPFTNRKFNIKVISVNEAVSNISVQELERRDIHSDHAGHLGDLLVALF